MESTNSLTEDSANQIIEASETIGHASDSNLNRKAGVGRGRPWSMLKEQGSAVGSQLELSGNGGDDKQISTSVLDSDDSMEGSVVTQNGMAMSCSIIDALKKKNIQKDNTKDSGQWLTMEREKLDRKLQNLEEKKANFRKDLCILNKLPSVIDVKKKENQMAKQDLEDENEKYETEMRINAVVISKLEEEREKLKTDLENEITEGKDLKERLDRVMQKSVDCRSNMDHVLATLGSVSLQIRDWFEKYIEENVGRVSG